MNYVLGTMFIAGVWVLAFSLWPGMTTRHIVGLHLIIIPIAAVIVEILR